MLVCVLIMFILLWGPLLAFYIELAVNHLDRIPNRDIRNWLFFGMPSLGFTQCVLNPYIYFITSA